MSFILRDYIQNLSSALDSISSSELETLVADLVEARARGRNVFLCGNGGSAANAMHWATDFLYGAGKTGLGGLKTQALSAATPVLSCLANDLGYENVFAAQLEVLGARDDLLVVLSGSGNSPNILKVLAKAKEMHIHSYAILGFDGGKALAMADHALHAKVHDIQIAEDCQMILGHLLTRRLALTE